MKKTYNTPITTTIEVNTTCIIAASGDNYLNSDGNSLTIDRDYLEEGDAEEAI